MKRERLSGQDLYRAEIATSRRAAGLVLGVHGGWMQPPAPEPEPEIMSPDARRTLESLGRCGPIWRILMHPDISAELESLGAIRASSLPLAPPWRGNALAWELTPEGCEFLGISPMRAQP